MSLGHGASIVRDGLMLHLDAANVKSYTGSGTEWNDLSGNDNNGTLTNGPLYSSDNNGTLTFDGVNDFSNHGDVLDMGTDSITISCWINPSLVASSNDWFISKAKAAAQEFRYGFGVEPGTNKLRTFFGPSLYTDILATASTTLSTNTWYMATGIFDRTGNMKIYLNGEEESVTGGNISSYSATNFQSNNPYRVGAYTAADNVSPHNPFHGKMSSVMHYNRILTSQEISQNFNALRGRYGI